MKSLPKSMKKIGAYSLVGVLNTCTDFFVFSICIWGMQLEPILANAIAFSIAVTQGFLLNTKWTFRDSGVGIGWKPYLRFVAINLGGLLISSLTIVALGNWTGPFLAKLASVGIVLFWGFLMARRFVFRSQKPNESNRISKAQAA